MYRLVCVFAAAQMAACGLIDPDIAEIDLSLPEKEVVVDSSRWGLPTESTLPELPCAADESICSTAVSDTCDPQVSVCLCAAEEDGCSGSCDGTNCELTVEVSRFHTFDLATEKPELQEIEGKPLVSITIKRVVYNVSENTLNVNTPPLTIYVGPQSAMTSDNPQALAIGTIPPVPAGTTVSEGEVELTPDGEEVLAQYMKDYSTQFNLIVGGDVVLAAGDPVPTGRLVAVVKAEATAGL